MVDAVRAARAWRLSSAWRRPRTPHVGYHRAWPRASREPESISHARPVDPLMHGSISLFATGLHRSARSVARLHDRALGPRRSLLWPLHAASFGWPAGVRPERLPAGHERAEGNVRARRPCRGRPDRCRTGSEVRPSGPQSYGLVRTGRAWRTAKVTGGPSVVVRAGDGALAPPSTLKVAAPGGGQVRGVGAAAVVVADRVVRVGRAGVGAGEVGAVAGVPGEGGRAGDDLDLEAADVR